MTQPVVITDSITTLGGGGQSGQGTVGQRLLSSGFDPNALRTLGTLRKDEWIQYDTAVIEIARNRLGAVNDLLSRNLRYKLPNALGKTRLEWERVSDMEGADITMSGISQSQNDRVVFDLQGMPIPIIHKDFNINLRALEASRTTGQPLDVTQAAYASRKVAETIEGMLFNGATVLGSNNPIYGYKTAPNRNTGSLSASFATATGDQMVKDLLEMIDQLIGDNMFGPYVVYVSNAAYVHMGDDYKAGSDKTILQRLKEIPQIADIKPSSYVLSTEVIMVQMSSEVVDIVDGMSPTTVEWDSHAGFIHHFKIMAIMIPRVRADYNNQSGIAHHSV